MTKKESIFLGAIILFGYYLRVMFLPVGALTLGMIKPEMRTWLRKL